MADIRSLSRLPIPGPELYSRIILRRSRCDRPHDRPSYPQARGAGRACADQRLSGRGDAAAPGRGPSRRCCQAARAMAIKFSGARALKPMAWTGQIPVRARTAVPAAFSRSAAPRHWKQLPTAGRPWNSGKPPRHFDAAAEPGAWSRGARGRRAGFRMRLRRSRGLPIAPSRHPVWRSQCYRARPPGSRASCLRPEHP